MSKEYIRHESVFFQFYGVDQKSLIYDSFRFLWSTCIQAGWWILQREKKSFTSIESCQRILYCNILHCRLRGISMPLLTHVDGDGVNVLVRVVKMLVMVKWLVGSVMVMVMRVMMRMLKMLMMWLMRTILQRRIIVSRRERELFSFNLMFWDENENGPLRWG